MRRGVGDSRARGSADSVVHRAVEHYVIADLERANDSGSESCSLLAILNFEDNAIDIAFG